MQFLGPVMKLDFNSINKKVIAIIKIGLIAFNMGWPKSLRNFSKCF